MKYYIYVLVLKKKKKEKEALISLGVIKKVRLKLPFFNERGGNKRVFKGTMIKHKGRPDLFFLLTSVGKQMVY